MTRAPPWTARLGFAAVLVFVASLVTLHAANFPGTPDHLSGFVHTSLAPLWILSLAGFALGGVALSVELRRRLATHRLRGPGVSLLVLAAFGALVLAACPVDADPYHRTTLGLIHEDVGPPTFLLTAVGMLLLAPVFHRAAGWRRYAVVSLVCGLFALLFGVAYVWATIAGDPMVGFLQRTAVAFIVTWMLFVAAGLLRKGKPDVQPAKGRSAVPRPTCAQ